MLKQNPYLGNIKLSALWYIIRQNSIDYSKNLTYTDFRTFVWYRLS